MSFSELWGKAEVEDKTFELLPEGTYAGKVEEVSLDLTSDPAVVKFQFVVIDGEFKNRKLWSRFRLQAQSLGFLKKTLKALAIDNFEPTKPEDFGELDNLCREKKVELYVNQKPSKDGKVWNNTYVNGILNYADLPGANSGVVPPQVNSGEELPF